VGKTALALEVARGAAKTARSVLVVSREMVNLALGRRLLVQEARVDAARVRGRRLSEEERGSVEEGLRRLRGLPVWLTDQAVSLRQITSLVAGWSASPHLDLLVVDYLQLVRAPRDIRERRLQVEALSQALKTLAVEHGLAVLCLSSLARTRDERGRDRRPTLADLRESGELEPDADVVLLLHREVMQPETEVIVAKNRDGRVGIARLLFRAESVAFDEPSDRAEDER
jgi:replicative DNA helicase